MNTYHAHLLDESPTEVLTDAALSNIPAGFQADISVILSILKSYNVRKVILYGSVARGDFHKDSDLDICVEGLENEVFFIALAECLISVKHSVSLVDFESTQGYFRERILQEGKVIYEQS
ncbi:MAG: nucleotidyltransferase domain-containing protein [Chloroflexi bacterium]|nr:nucleotidyltransferase domain-containing protein [Chloroflexota bacterium]